MASQPTTPPSAEVRRKRKSDREKVRLAAAVAVGALGASFAVLNTGDVKANWIIGTQSTPLIVVLLVWFVLGLAADRIMVVRARRRARASRGSRPKS
ncbi:MAG TPA: hypothetical protein VGH93_12030 [Solirubrobacteraceae bacterium]|jgi:uncharacterized integral membrane protein